MPELPKLGRRLLDRDRRDSHRIRVWALRALLAGGGYWAAGRLGLAFPSPSPYISLFWPALGLALAVLVRWGSAQTPALFVGSVLVNHSSGAPLWLAILIALGNVGAAWVAAQWLRRNGLNLRLDQWRDIWRVLVAGGLGCSVLTAANGCAWLTVAGLLSPLDLPLGSLRWWMGDLLGVLVTAIPLLCIRRDSWPKLLSSAQRWSTPALMGLAVLATGAAFALPTQVYLPSVGLLILPPLLLSVCAMRSGLAVASTAVLVLALGMFSATALAWGPFVSQPADTGLNLLWAYTLGLAGLVLLPHAHLSELTRLEGRWSLALEGSDLGVADWSNGSDLAFSNPRWRELMDDPDGSQTASLNHWLDMVHIDDRGALSAALAPKPPSHATEAHHRHELRVRVTDQWRWFDIHLIVAERDAAGTAVRVVVSAADISERHAAEAAQQLSSNLFMNLHEGLIVTDADLRVIDANPTYSRITGVAREDLIGSVPSLLRATASDPITRAQQAGLWAALRTQGNWVGEVVERRANGDPCALHVTVSSVHGPDGALRYHMLMVSDVTEARLQRDRFERQAHFDELTRLPNRARLGQLLAEAMAGADRDKCLLAVCYLDLDHFKLINERLGHAAGDLLLAETANRMRGALRNRGLGWSDAAARLGGDEFVLLLRADTVEEARAAVERVLRLVAQPLTLVSDSAPVVVTASVGATVYPLDRSDADTLLRHADHAMYGVKQSGRNGYLFFDPEYSRRTEERVLAIGRVQDALDHHELVLYFQPKVDLRHGIVLGFEALLRWNHPEHGLVPPAQFLPLIENTGLSARIGDFVLASALDQLDAWTLDGLDLSVSVNISARHLQEPDFAQRMAELLARHARPLGSRLELEMLETAALTDIGFSSALMARCAGLGVRWALDDFGTGYSTLTYLKRLPVQVLKIDRSFVHNMLEDAQDRAIVEGVISLARTFGCTAVAEGVETPAQGRMLLDMGCEIGQGTGIAAPMPAANVVAWIREWRGLFALAAAPVGLRAEDAADLLPPDASLGNPGKSEDAGNA